MVLQTGVLTADHRRDMRISTRTRLGLVVALMSPVLTASTCVTSLLPLYGGATYGMYTMRPDGSDLVRIYSGDAMRNHAHVRDGRVVFSQFTRDVNRDGRLDERDLAGAQIGVMNLDGTNVHMVTPAPGYNLTPSWSPDGNSIVFSSDQAHGGGILDLLVYDTSTGVTRDLTNTPAVLEGDPHWSGHRVLFNRLQNGVEAIWMMNDDGTDARQLTWPPATGVSAGMYPFGDFDPALSPDGRYLAFERHIGDARIWQGMAIGTWNLILRDLWTGSESVISGSANVDASPAWSPDGTALAYWELLPKSFSLFTYRIADGQTSELFAGTPGMQAETPDWYVEHGQVRLVFSTHVG